MNKDFHCLIIVKKYYSLENMAFMFNIIFYGYILYSNTMFLIKIIVHLASTILRQ